MEDQAVHDRQPAVSDDDAELVEQCQLGSTAAFGELVKRYQDRLFNLCWRMSGSRHDAEELTQEAFLKAFRAIDRFGGRAKFYTWLYGIAVNVAISARRKGRRPAPLSLHCSDSGGDGLPPSVADPASDEPSAVEQVTRREENELVAEALASLDEEYRSVIVLRDLESFGYEQIAEILEVPVGTVKSRLHRGRLALRKKLAPILKTEA